MELLLIEIKNISKHYGSLAAVDSVSLKINKNEIYGVIGLSGAGKSTLIRLINRLEEADNGSVIINNQDLNKADTKELYKARKKIGMIFQGFNLLSSRDVRGNVAYPLEIAGWSKKEITPRVEELLKLVGLEEKINSPVSSLSGGQKQRVAIARALANSPDILLCDEATSALDPQTTKSILNLIKNIQAKYGLTVILITHQMEVIKEVCHRVALMEKGKVIEESSVEEIFSNPKTELAREFVEHIRRDSRDYMDFFKYERKPHSQLFKLHFTRESAGEPIIYNLIKSSEAIINILSGDIFKLTSSNVGELVIEITGSKMDRKGAVSYLKSKDVGVEEIYG